MSTTGNLKRRLPDVSGPLQRRCVQGLMTKIVVDRKTATVCGPPLALAAAVASPDSLGEVRCF